MAGILRGLGLLPKVRLPMAPGSHIIQRAKISSKPAKYKVSAAENIFVMAVFGLTILGPSGWILANVKNYQKRD